MIGYVRRTLADRSRAAFFASQAADEAYYQLSDGRAAPHARRRRWWIARLFTDLHRAGGRRRGCSAGAALGDAALSEFGARALDRVLTLTYRPGEGVAHWFDGHVGIRGLLTDQVHASRALLILHEATGNPDVVDARRGADAHRDAHSVGRGAPGAFSTACPARPTPSACWPIR